MSSPKVLVTAQLHPIAIELMKKDNLDVHEKPLLPKDEILKVIGGYDCIVTRSDTPVDSEIMDAGDRLRVVGRAAIGVDNIDIEHATKKGILIVNVPADNVVSAAEHTFALMLASMRNVNASSALLKENQWERKRFQGLELKDKILGIVGLGKVGSHVAKIARGFGMEVWAYDPYISEEKFEKCRAQKKSSLMDLVKGVDVITLHTPKTRETLGMLDYLTLKESKKGAVFVNCARGGIADEDAILRLLDEDHLSCAGVDVFSKEPITNHPLHHHERCVCTPHLGASTIEAQERVGKTIARQVARALKNEVVDFPVNMPLVKDELFDLSRGFCTLAEKLGLLCRQLTTFNPSFMRMVVSGKDLGNAFALLEAAFFKGYFEGTSEQNVNYINSIKIAEQRGLKLEAVKDPLHETYSHLLKVEVYGTGEPVTAAGTIFGLKARVVELNGYNLDMAPDGTMLMIRNNDKPGVIGHIGGILGDNGVNIARWELGRKEIGGEALGLVKLDQRASDEILRQIAKHEGILQVKQLELGTAGTPSMT